MNASFKKYPLHFKQPAMTSRGRYENRPVWFLFLEDNGTTGIGECAPLAGLSRETPEQVEHFLTEITAAPKLFTGRPELLREVPSVRFALEMAWLDLQQGGTRILFPSSFTEGQQGIPVNGLIWMGNREEQERQIRRKLDVGFRCIKLKIGALHVDEELELLKILRAERRPEALTLRVDANGAFNPDDALSRLQRLAPFEIHSIEQPIAAGNWEQMARLCAETPVPIALDEELIGVNTPEEKEDLLDTIRPQFLVLKPSLHGGFSGCDEWIELSGQRSIGWWITSYLESNVGLNAIAQWTFTKQVSTHQGLGTGQLFRNNFDSPLEMRGEELWFDPLKEFSVMSGE
ncbi:MAG: o-succinylbenzoate synthase [Mangrovibacterium sp.]|nr:o-succinylbenzoate synthase [Mangrovibacterium sp.]